MLPTVCNRLPRMRTKPPRRKWRGQSCVSGGDVIQINWRMLPKRYLFGGGLFVLLIIVLIIGAVHPYKHALGSQPVALTDVETLHVQQADVPIYGEGIGTLDGRVDAD